MASGADVMSPGIVEADPQIKEGDTVIIVDEKHHKPLAMGKPLYLEKKWLKLTKVRQ
jgi:PUA domain protein